MLSVYWPFVYLLWKDYYSSPLPIFYLGALSFCSWVIKVLSIFCMWLPYQKYGLWTFPPILYVAFSFFLFFFDSVLWCTLLFFNLSVVSDSSQPHGLQHTRPPCPSPSPRACSNSCPLSWWYHPTISSSVVPLSSCFQSFPASESFLMSQLFASGGQSIRASPSASVLLMNIQGWFPLGF